MVLIFTLAFAIATAQESLIREVRAHLSDVKRWGGRILLIVGAWFIILSVFADFFADIFPV